MSATPKLGLGSQLAKISSAVSTVLRGLVCARAMGDWRSIVDTAIWTKPTESLWVLNGFPVVRRLKMQCCVRRLKD